jgi:hypothetical protein
MPMLAPTDRPPPSTGFLVWHLSMRWRMAMNRALSPLGLTSSQYGVLASLYAFSDGGARPRQRELADFAGLEPMHVSKLIRAFGASGAGGTHRSSGRHPGGAAHRYRPWRRGGHGRQSEGP